MRECKGQSKCSDPFAFVGILTSNQQRLLAALSRDRSCCVNPCWNSIRHFVTIVALVSTRPVLKSTLSHQGVPSERSAETRTVAIPQVGTSVNVPLCAADVVLVNDGDLPAILKAPMMKPLTAFRLFAVTAMLVCYAFKNRNPWFILAFAASCGLGSIYGFLQGAWPFGLIEAVWAVVATRRWWIETGHRST